MSKHTPGPWRIHAGTIKFHIDNNKEGVCSTSGDSIWDEANANLIAAAPELLEALKEIIKLYGRSRLPARVDAIAKGKAAIAKAEGRE